MNAPVTPQPGELAEDFEEDITPEEIALAAMQGLLASGRFENAQAAVDLAWLCVPAFYTARDKAEKLVAQLNAGVARSVATMSNQAAPIKPRRGPAPK